MPRIAPRYEWGPIRDEFINGPATFRSLGEKHDIPWSTIARRAKKEGWLEMRQAQGRAVASRSFEGMAADIEMQERAVRLQQIAVLRATLMQYSKDLLAGQIKVSARDMVETVKALSELMAGGVPGGVGGEASEPKNVTPGEDADFYRRLVETARTRVAPGSVGAGAVSGAPPPRTN